MLFVSYHCLHPNVGGAFAFGDIVLDNESAPKDENDIARIKERIRQQFLIDSGQEEERNYPTRVRLLFWAPL